MVKQKCLCIKSDIRHCPMPFFHSFRSFRCLFLRSRNSLLNFLLLSRSSLVLLSLYRMGVSIPSLSWKVLNQPYMVRDNTILHCLFFITFISSFSIPISVLTSSFLFLSIRYPLKFRKVRKRLHSR